MKKVALAIDELHLATMLAQHLSRHGYAPVQATHINALRELARTGEADAIVLALAVENRSGLDWLKDIRAESAVPIILLNDSGNELDCIVGLELGADDSLMQPFEPRMFIARLRAVLRRCLHTCPSGATCLMAAGTTASFAGWTYDAMEKTLVSPTGKKTLLSMSESRLIEAFLRYPQIILRRENLLHALGRSPANTRDDCVTIQMSRLRKKLDADTSRSPVIKTERGLGYFLDETVTWRKEPSKHCQAGRCPVYACACIAKAPERQR